MDQISHHLANAPSIFDSANTGMHKYGDLAEFFRMFPMRTWTRLFVIETRVSWLQEGSEWRKIEKKGEKRLQRDLLFLLIGDLVEFWTTKKKKKQFTPYSQRSMTWAGLFSKIQLKKSMTRIFFLKSNFSCTVLTPDNWSKSSDWN